MRIATLAVPLAALLLTPAASAQTAQTLPFSQNWTNTGMITVDDDWSGVAGMIGYRGDDFGTGVPTTVPAVDAQTVLADMSATPVDVNANEADPNTFTTGGLAEFDALPNPAVALNGSGTADAPHMIIRINTAGQSNIRVQFNIRDLDGSLDDAFQQVNVQYRVGTSGDFTNVVGGYVADATTAGSATQVTPVDVFLPGDADNQASVDIRVMSINAQGNDEWVGIDDIQVSAGPVANEPRTDGGGPRLELVGNPISGSTAVRIVLAQPAAVRLSVHDVTGREVAALMSGMRPAGASTATFDTAGLAPGAYVVRLVAGGASAAQTVTVAR